MSVVVEVWVCMCLCGGGDEWMWVRVWVDVGFFHRVCWSGDGVWSPV